MEKFAAIYFGILIALATAIPSGVFAQVTRSSDVKANRAFIYHGKLVRPDGSLPSGSINAILKIQSPDPSLCSLWVEAQTVTMKDGAFSIEIGHAANRVVGASGGAAADFSQVFVNNPSLTIPSANCAQGTSYTPAVTDDRLLTAIFTDEGKTVEIADLPIKSVPYALQAEQLSGFGVANLMKISGAGSPVTMTPAEADSLKDLLGGDIDWNMKSRKVTNVADPVATSDATNRGWVLAQISSAISGFGAGTISSIGFTAPAGLFSVSGSPMTANGSIGLTLNNQSANQIFAGPASGGAAQPGFRALDAADIPSLDAGKITSGTFTASQIPSIDSSKISTGVLGAARGGTGLAPSMANANKVLGLNASGSDTEYKSITAGTNVTITPSVGGIEISAASSGGTVTGLSSGNSYLSITNPSTTPNLTLNVGSVVNTVAAGNDSRFPSGTCASGSKNRWNGSAWICEADIDTNSGGTVTSVSVGGLPLGVTNGTSTPQITITQANTTTAGYLSATDWNTFNNKQPAGAYLTSINSSQVTTALGYTPVNKAGDTMTGNLAFSATNPTITSGGSYITIPNGIHVSGGTPYFQTQIQARGGIANDNAAALTIAGGTSGRTYFTGNVGIGVAAPAQKLEVVGQIVGTNSAGHGLVVTGPSSGSSYYAAYAQSGSYYGALGRADGYSFVGSGALYNVGSIRSTSGGFIFPDGTTQTTAASAGVSGSCRICIRSCNHSGYSCNWTGQSCSAYSTGALQAASTTTSTPDSIETSIQCQ